MEEIKKTKNGRNQKKQKMEEIKKTKIEII